MLNIFRKLVESIGAAPAASVSLALGCASNKRYPNAQHLNCREVFFTDAALAQIVSECLAHDPNETGLVLIGHIHNDQWYVLEAISPGFDRVKHETCYHEIDHLYTNYEMQVRKRIYSTEPTVLGTVHRHPACMNTFSSTDDEMNRQYEALVGKGNLSFLVTFRDGQPQFWGYYHLGGVYYHTDMHVDDHPFRQLGFLRHADLEQMLGNRKRYQKDMQHIRALVCGEEKGCENVHANAACQQDGHGYLIDRHALHGCRSGKKLEETLLTILPEVSKDVDLAEISKDERDALLADIRNMNLGDDDEPIQDMYDQTCESAKAVKRMRICDAIPHDYVGEVFGVHNDGYFHALQPNEDFGDLPAHFNSVGLLLPPEIYGRIRAFSQITEVRGYDWYGTFQNGFFQTATARHEVMYTTEFPFTAATSRNVGIIESDALKEKLFVAIGVGSMCSYMLMQAAKCGFGNFILADPDRLEIHNLSRHWLGCRDLGRLKVEAMAEQIWQVNPFAKIAAFPGKIEEMPIDEAIRALASRGGVVVSGGDNRAADKFGNELAKELNLAFVSTGCFERAAAGEVFEWIPEADLPLYGEVFEGMIDAGRKEGHRAYIGDEQQDMNFVPGIWVDICSVSNLAFKVALELTMRDDPHFVPKLIGSLTNYTLICNTNHADCGCRLATKFPEPMMHTTRKRGGIWLKGSGDAARVKLNFDE